ncbi:MAG: peptide ABC transporter substrate-binding protein [Chloroflexi bacterium]|nr:peptide ABC transporter substrate-binding protein [Chloroflexota bacterium]
MQDWTKDPQQLEFFEQRTQAAGVSRRGFLKILGAASAAAALAACAPAPAAPVTSGDTTAAPVAAGEAVPDAEQIFRQPWADEPSSHDFNKYLYCAGETELFAGLTRFDKDYKPQPYVAEKWELSADGSVYTFHIKPGQKWSNGDPVTAQDFEWSFKRQLDPATQAEYAAFLFDLKNAEAFNTKQGDIKIDDVGVKATDDLTLEITLEGPRGYFLTVLAFTAALPAHKGAVEKFGDKWTEAANIVTNGPWKLMTWDHEQEMIFERFEDFILEPKPKLRKRISKIIATDAQLAAYEANEIDRARVPLPELQRIKDDPVLSKEIQTFSQTGTFYLAPSYTMKPFDLKEVRQALNHAIDRDTLVKDVLQGIGQTAYTFVPPDSPGYIDPAKYSWVKELTEYNPQKAIDLLKGTPYEGGKNWPEITITFRTNELSELPVQAIQAMLKQNLNMEIKLEAMEQKAFRAKMWAHEIQLNYVRWYMDYPDPNNDSFLVWYSSRSSGSRHEFKNAEYDKLVTDAAAATEWDKRMELYAQAEQLMIEDGAATYVYYPFGIRLYKPWVQGLPKNSAGLGVQDWNIYFALPQEVYIADAPDRPKLS